jgi:hypothetical protein
MHVQQSTDFGTLYRSGVTLSMGVKFLATDAHASETLSSIDGVYHHWTFLGAGEV